MSVLRSALAFSIAVVFLALLLAVQPGESIKCFDCNSHNDSRCALEVPPEMFKKDCSEHIEGSKYTLCRKIVQSIEHEVNGLQPDSRVIRTCGWDSSSQVGRCYQRSGFGGRQEVCTCTTDLCNDAPRKSSSSLLFGLFAAGFVFLPVFRAL